MQPRGFEIWIGCGMGTKTKSSLDDRRNEGRRSCELSSWSIDRLDTKIKRNIKYWLVQRRRCTIDTTESLSPVTPADREGFRANVRCKNLGPALDDPRESAARVSLHTHEVSRGECVDIHLRSDLTVSMSLMWDSISATRYPRLSSRAASS